MKEDGPSMSGILPCGTQNAMTAARTEGAQAANPAADTPPLDADRAARLKDAIAAGHYPVDAAKLAERLLTLGLFPGGDR